MTNSSSASRVTLKQIAQELGVSHQLVSFALNDARGVNEDTRTRIKEAAERMGYRRNVSAATMRSGRFGTIGVLSPRSQWGAPQGDIAYGLQSEAEAGDYHLTMGTVPDEELQRDECLPRLLSEWMCDGLVIHYIHNPPQRLAGVIRRFRLPAMWLNVEGEFDCVHPDDYAGAISATEYLLRLGHERIAYVQPLDSPHYSVGARQKGFEEAMRRAGLNPRTESFPGGVRHEVAATQRIERARAVLSGLDRPTAVLGYGFPFSVAFYMAALGLGLQVPRDLSLLTFDENIPHLLGTSFSLLRIPFIEMGREAVRGVMDKIADPSLVIPTRVLPYPDPQGETCVPPPTHASNGR